MEILRPNPAPGRLRFAVFDFDGTLSLLRAGWQAVMADLMIDVLSATPGAEPEAQLRALAAEPIHGLAGRPTLVQMQWLVDEVRRRGGAPETAEAYKREYLARLARRLQARTLAEARPAALPRSHVAGALEFVAALRARSVACWIASGTDEAAVRDEAARLGFAPLAAQIRGAREDGADAKRAVIDEIVAHWRPGPGGLAIFGDGCAEMEYARQAGALAIGVASTEDERPGVDEPKRARLIGAGADVIVPDFRPPGLLTYFWHSE